MRLFWQFDTMTSLQVFMLEQNCHPHSTVQRLFIFIWILALKITTLQCYCLYLVLLNEYLKRIGLTSPKRTRDLSLTNEGVKKINPKSWAIKWKSDSILRGAWLHVCMEFIIFTGSKYVGVLQNEQKNYWFWSQKSMVNWKLNDQLKNI